MYFVDPERANLLLNVRITYLAKIILPCILHFRVFGFRRVTKNFHAQKNCDGRTYSYTLPTFAFAKPTEVSIYPIELNCYHQTACYLN